MNQQKSFCLVILDLFFWIFPDCEIFGETVRDLLICDQFYNINLILRKPVRSFARKIQKLKDVIEINGYILKIESTQNYRSSWNKFEGNYIRYGLTQGLITKIGTDDQIQVSLMTPNKVSDYEPIFTCNMLTMTKEGLLGIIPHSLEKLNNNKTLSHNTNLFTTRTSILNKILDDIYAKHASLIKVVKVKSGYEDRFYRSRLIFLLVELLERGWEADSIDLKEIGFNLKIDRINPVNSKFIFPNLENSYNNLLFLNNFNESSRDDDEQSESSENICPICHEDLNNYSTLKLDCSHYFHSFCIYKHFHKIGSSSTLCPICRTLIVCETRNPRDENNSSDSSSYESTESSSEIIGQALDSSNDSHTDDTGPQVDLAIEHAVDTAVEQAITAIHNAMRPELPDAPTSLPSLQTQMSMDSDDSSTTVEERSERSEQSEAEVVIVNYPDQSTP